MANWSNPTLTSLYTDFLSELKARDEDLAKQFDGQTVSNLITGTIRWSSSANRWQKWTGSAWGELTTTYALTGLSTTGNATIGGTLGVTGAATLSGGGTSTTPATADNSTAIATTAYVKAQAYATLASPALTGTPTAPTAAADTNTTQLATTAYVLGQGSSTSPAMAGTAAAGTALKWARADHVHPTDTSRAPLASPAFTGTPAAPTATVGTNTTQLATTAFVLAQIAAGGTLTSALGIIAGTAAAPGLFVSGDSNTGIYSPGADQLAIGTGGTGRLFIDSSGRVGIGTTSPSFNLDVFGSGTQTIRAITTDTSGTAIGRLRAFYTGGGGGTQSAVDLRAGDAYAYLATEGSIPLLFGVNLQERARIDSTGRLLVGTSSDSGGALLQVNGDRIRVGTAKTPASATATGTAGEICWDASYLYVCTASNTWKRAALSTW